MARVWRFSGSGAGAARVVAAVEARSPRKNVVFMLLLVFVELCDDEQKAEECERQTHV
jgi:hypothetical protein